jgi:hypothetical protein
MKGRLTLLYVLTLCLVFTLMSAMPLTADAQMIEEWVARYNGPGNGLDDPRGMAVDGSGNVYVTGVSDGNGSGWDYNTVKYDPNGNQLWVAYYNSAGNGNDRPRALGIDGSGNVYVTGDSPGSGGDYDYTTVKYNTNGNQLWVTQYNGLGSGNDRPRAIAVDGSGNVYVTGKSPGSGGDNDYATVKYNTNGNQLWAKRYNGPGSDWDEALAIAVDGSGNVYVTGMSIGSGTWEDYATVKYNSAGNQLWVKRYNGPGNDLDAANAIAVDTLGNVYVTGGVYYNIMIDSNSDYATVKYNSAGNQLWVKRYNGTGNYNDEAVAIAVDSLGNIYLTGASSGSGTWNDYTTMKYDSNGNELWVKRYNGPANSYDNASALAIDESGNVYVTGESGGSGTGDDYATVKYDTNGNELWVKRYDGPASGDDRAYFIAVDESENVYVTGLSRGSGTGSDFATIKYVKTEEIEVTMELPAEWTMISLPVMPDKATLNDLFPEAVVVYKFLKTMGYVRVIENENFEVGMGYWILLNTPQTYKIKGMAITEYTFLVEDGWYMIGGCTSPAQKTVKNGNYDVVYGFSQDTGYIRIPDPEPLQPKQGYWILISDTTEGAEFTASTSLSQ